MPMPAEITLDRGVLPVSGSFRVSVSGCSDPLAQRAVTRFLTRMSKRAGASLATAENGAAMQVRCGAVADDESYTVRSSDTSALLSAPGPLGILRGLETVLQLTTEKGIATATISDRPRYKWRGFMLDVCRHFMPLDAVKRQIDGMAAVKLNVFHWHLSDDQGVRVESKVYPRLQTHASDGKYYTQAQIRELVEYARERGIRVVPEFDVPGHASAIIAAYPSLGSARGPATIARTWNMLNGVLDPTREEVYTFIERFFGEMATLFPDSHFHMGGDEVNAKVWRSNPKIQAFARKEGLTGRMGLHNYFTGRVGAILRKLDRTMIGWDEILQPDLPQNTVIQSWRGTSARGKATDMGYKGILSNGYYLDHMKPASFHYAKDPGDGERILGGEACMWTEYVTADNVDMRVWPRLAAIAERLWSPASVRDVDSMYTRLQGVSAQLADLGLQHESSRTKMLTRLAGRQPVKPLEVLATALEPVKMYARSTSRQYTTLTPMNRMVDATPPESLTARQLAQSVEAALRGDAAARQTARSMLSTWRDNHKAVLPVLQGNPLLTEIVPLATYVYDVASVGLQALDGQTSPEWQEKASKLLDTEGRRVPTLATQRACMAVMSQYNRRRATVRRQCGDARYLEELIPVIVEPVRKLVDSAR